MASQPNVLSGREATEVAEASVDGTSPPRVGLGGDPRVGGEVGGREDRVPGALTAALPLFETLSSRPGRVPLCPGRSGRCGKEGRGGGRRSKERSVTILSGFLAAQTEQIVYENYGDFVSLCTRNRHSLITCKIESS